jgi:DNA-binding beta-propeller fold protein YncE
VVTVTLTDTLGGVVVVTQADTITATVTGPATVSGVTNLNVNFLPCTYTTTPTATGTTAAAKPCPTDGSFGTISNVQPTTEIYTAPATIPDPTTYPNLVLTITATSVADPTKKGTINLSLDSGILVTITPVSATLAVGVSGGTGESKLFIAALTSDTNEKGVTWGITNSTVNTGGTPSIANTYTLTTPQCSPSCGTITAAAGGNETFTAPSTLPTNTTVTIYAIANADPTRFALATISLVNGGTITFNSIWPTIVPQGGALADIFINATNLTSQIGILLKNNTTGVTTPIDAGSNALKVYFTPSTYAATTGPVSTGARLRLTADELAQPVTYTITITSEGGTIAGSGTVQVVPVRPGLVATNPTNISEGSASQGFSLDGGYFGPAEAPIVGLNFNDSGLNPTPQPSTNDPRRLVATANGPINTAGLVPIGVTNTMDATSPATAYSNIAILPAYANPSLTPSSLPYDTTNTTFAPCFAIAALPACLPADINGNIPTRYPQCQPATTNCGPYPATIPLGATTNPGAIAVDPILNLAAVTEAGTDMVQFINLGSNNQTTITPPSLLGAFRTGPAAVNLPTSVAIDRNVCTTGAAGSCSVSQAVVAVVNYAAQTLTVLTIPGGTLLETIPMNNLIPPSGLSGSGANPTPSPFAVTIDPFTHRALVAFASTNAGFVVNLDQSQSPNICLPGFVPADGSSYCPVAFATLNTGANPQLAYEPGAHLAYVTPGGAGTLTEVNLSNPSQGPLKILSATRMAGIVTVTMEPNTPHNLPIGSNPTVLISGLPLGTGSPTSKPPIAPTSFNGAFPVLEVTSNLTFTYAQAGPDDSTTSTAGQQGFLSVGTSDITFIVTPTVQGIDINPITHSAVLADPNAAGVVNSSGAQITFIDSLDETTTSLNLCSGQNLAIRQTSVPCAPELGTSAVAYEPFTNTVAALNYQLNEISLLNPAGGQRVTIVQTGQTAAACVPTSACTAGAPITSCGGISATQVNLCGAIAVDPVLNLALAVNSGSGTITPLYLGHVKPLQIETVFTPPVDATGVAMPATIPQSVIIGPPATQKAVSGVKIFGSGFASDSQVRFDGVPLASGVTFVSSNELDVTIPAPTPPGSGGTVYTGVLSAPRNFGLDVANTNGTTSNVMDFHVIQAIALPACTAGAAEPGAVAIANDLVGTKTNYAVVTELGCAQVAVISLNHDASFGTFSTITTGNGPADVATIPRFGYAVVTNSTDGTASILDLTKGTRAAGATTDVVVGKSPNGVAIEQETGLAVVANTDSNTATVIDLTPLQASPVGTLAPLTVATDEEPIAVAIDPDRGSNATGLAVITTLNISSTPASGALDAVDISLAVPAKNSTATTSIGAIPTGIVYDPASASRYFYATESESNSFIAYDPDTGGTQTQSVGINPFAIAFNFQTSSILTINSTSNTISIVDALTLPFRTEATLGIGGISLFSAAIEPFSNLAVIADQANNRVLLFPMPH